jgi:ABC-type dipeptide/oligopeptide/nickel transport system permease subunit
VLSSWLAPYPPEAASVDVSVPPPDLAALPHLLLQAATGRLDRPVHWFGTDDAGLNSFEHTKDRRQTRLV